MSFETYLFLHTTQELWFTRDFLPNHHKNRGETRRQPRKPNWISQGTIFVAQDFGGGPRVQKSGPLGSTGVTFGQFVMAQGRVFDGKNTC